LEFTDLGLKSSSLKAIEALGFKTPSEIQAKSIPLLLAEDIDFIGQAQTGTGKTAAFVLPLLEKIDFKLKDPQALIVAPTRELAYQIAEEIKKLSQFEMAKTVCVYGGIPMGGQIREIKTARPQIIVGTPGRIIDMIDRGVLKVETCKYVVLDEADEMLDMGFFEDVKMILEEIPSKKIWMFSATMPKPIMELVQKYFCEPVRVKVTKEVLTSQNIEQKFVVVRAQDQIEALVRMLDFEKEMYGIVFCRTKIGASELAGHLNQRGYAADALHGDMSQDQRDYTMKNFKERRIKLLICTDVAARGIDVYDLTHVINFSLPQDNESYVHRIGRTGRGGNKGVALSIITPSELSRVSQIERITKAKIERITLPKISDIRNSLLEKSIAKLDNYLAVEIPEEEMTNFKERLADKSADDLLKVIYGLCVESGMKRYRKAVSLDIAPRERTQTSSRDMGRAPSRSSSNANGASRFFINLGGAAGLTTGELIKFVTSTLRVRGSDVGRIQIMEQFSFFEMPSSHIDAVLSLSNSKWNNFKVSVEVAREKKPSDRSSDRGYRSEGRSRDRGDYSRGSRSSRLN
jgi:ATP-dependent RNA helicase DeaD